ncbi:putative magnesium transporter NIPA2-like isoform 1 [Capsicum annuum]|nr:putative magnesium transporter NIPA2-like isoform 1 [Capsicum annuum]
MEEQEFQRLLELFPAVRSPDFYLDLDASSQSTSQSEQKEEVKQLQDDQSKGGIESNTRSKGHGEAFWGKLKAAAEKKELPRYAANTNLVLIPKKEIVRTFGDLRPISLSNFVDKEIIRDIDLRNKQHSVVVKLDMTKAYDRVSWKFPVKLLTRFGFFEMIIDIVVRLISSNWSGHLGMKKMIRILREYEKVSGQLINLDKSLFYLHEETGINIEDMDLQIIHAWWAINLAPKMEAMIDRQLRIPWALIELVEDIWCKLHAVLGKAPQIFGEGNTMADALAMKWLNYNKQRNFTIL